MTLVTAPSVLEELVTAVHAAVRPGHTKQRTIDRVAAALRANLPSPEMVPPPGDCATGTRLLHTDPGGAFSIQAIYWRPGQTTRIHDHVAWCVFGVVQGVEHEELFRLSEDGAHLIAAGSSMNLVGDVSGFAPPGDIHRVRDSGTSEAISIHIYGTDLSRLGSSARRFYDLPVVPPGCCPELAGGVARLPR
jgi:predicted metal-dependent enzyme (double-stranded beta helix superfamily)